ncbi:MAG: hypothetical protein R2815_02160 [Flavobacteriales bacterium]
MYRVIQANPSREGEAVETAWRNLTELQILIPTEPGGDLFIVADPIHRLMAYLFDEAHATTPEIVRGYILSLETNHSQLGRAIDAEDIASVQLALEDIQRTLRRIRADVEETHRCVLSEVSLFKAERRGVTVKQKFRRIRQWMDSYVAPMVEIVKVEGN